MACKCLVLQSYHVSEVNIPEWLSQRVDCIHVYFIAIALFKDCFNYYNNCFIKIIINYHKILIYYTYNS